MLRLMLLTAALVSTVGCFGAVHPSLSYRKFGEADPQAERKVTENFEAHLAPTSPDAKVKVLVNSIPEGIEVSAEVISVKQGYQHELLGRFTLGKGGSAWSFPDYEAGWKKGYCYPQTPLHWFTLGIWGLLPIAYPCNVPNLRPKEYWLDQAREVARTVDGDVVMGSYVGEGEDEAYGFSGVVLKRDPKLEDLKATPLPKQTTTQM
jgi:hypothetical protein